MSLSPEGGLKHFVTKGGSFEGHLARGLGCRGTKQITEEERAGSDSSHQPSHEHSVPQGREPEVKGFQ